MDDAQRLGQADRHYLIAPAGFGKTYLIAQTVSEHCHGRQLLLTHTHAGVRAMRARLVERGCRPDRFRIETISGWALRYAAAYPATSGVHPLHPAGAQWKEIYRGAAEVLATKAVRRVVQLSYSGLFVDEYQDCTKAQHQLVTALAELLPCRLLGDPLQGIFDFELDPMDWATDIDGQFAQLPRLRTPHRWIGRNDDLGKWLVQVRQQIEDKQAIPLQGLPVGARWLPLNSQAQLQACWGAIREPGTVAAIHEGALEKPCHRLARSLGGHYQCMEAVDCKDLYSWAQKIEDATGCKRAALLIDFASLCLTKVGTELATIRTRLRSGSTGAGKLRKHLDILSTLRAVAATSSLAPAIAALHTMRQMREVVLFRRELWESLLRSLREYLSGGFACLADAAWSVRDHLRRNGRSQEPRTVSRTLLVKGLEYDHAIVLDADKLDARQLYVALTRGSRRLTVLSEQPILQS